MVALKGGKEGRLRVGRERLEGGREGGEGRERKRVYIEGQDINLASIALRREREGARVRERGRVRERKKERASERVCIRVKEGRKEGRKEGKKVTSGIMVSN